MEGEVLNASLKNSRITGYMQVRTESHSTITAVTRGHLGGSMTLATGNVKSLQWAPIIPALWRSRPEDQEKGGRPPLASGLRLQVT